MDLNTPVNNEKTDPLYSITDLSLDIQELIDNELKRETKMDNWLCFKCGILNEQHRKVCECGEPNIEFTKDSSSESSFEIITDEENIPKNNETDCDSKNKQEIEMWLCCFCGKASNSKNCCQNLFKNHEVKNDDFTWECAWCFTKNNENYIKCTDCGHLRLDNVSNKNTEVVNNNEEKNCWDPRKWFTTEQDNTLEQKDFTLKYIGEKSEKTFQKDPHDVVKLDFSTGELEVKTKNLEKEFSTASVDVTDCAVGNVKNISLKKDVEETKSNILNTKNVKKKVKFNNDFLTNYTMIGKDLVLVERKAKPTSITMDMLQDALKFVNISSQTKETGCNSPPKRISRSNSSTQTESPAGNHAQNSKRANCEYSNSNNDKTKQNTNKNFHNHSFKNNKWKCSQCKLVNPSSGKYCFVCHKPRFVTNDTNKDKTKDNKVLVPQKITENHKSTQVRNTYDVDQFTEFANSIVKDTSNQAFNKIQAQNLGAKNRKQKARQRNNKKEKRHYQKIRMDPNTNSDFKKLEKSTHSNKTLDSYKKVSAPLQPSNTALLLNSNFDLNYSWTCRNCKLLNPGNIEKCSGCKSDSLLELSDIFDEKNNLKKSSNTIEILQKFLGQEIAQSAYQTSANEVKNTTINQPEKLVQNVDAAAENNWRCEVCTFLNTQHLKRCRMCQKEKLEKQIENFPKLEQLDSTKTEEPASSNLEKNTKVTFFNIPERSEMLIDSNNVTLEEVSTNANQILINDQEAMLRTKSILQNSEGITVEMALDEVLTDANQILINDQDSTLHTKTILESTFDITDSVDLNQKTINVNQNEKINNWICKICTLINSEDTNTCSTCLNSRNEPTKSVETKPIMECLNTNCKWKCHQCTYVNDPYVAECFMCKSKNITNLSSQTSLNVSNNAFWTCPMCTLQNIKENDVCCACNHNRNTLKERQNQNRVWKCQECTFENSIRDKICSMCSAENENLRDNARGNNWNCDVCTLENSEGDETCSACQNERIHRITADSTNISKQNQNFDDNKNWTCPKCTLDNFESQNCIACGTNRTLTTNDTFLQQNKAKTISSQLNTSICGTNRTLMTNDTCLQQNKTKTSSQLKNLICSSCKLENNCCCTNKTYVTTENIVRVNQEKIENLNLVGSNSEVLLNNWRCNVCTFLNSDTLTHCRTCKTIRNETQNLQSSLTNHTNNENWKCSSCKLLNSNDIKKCNACETARFNETQNLPNISESVWICESCKAKNKFGSFKCSSCNKLNLSPLLTSVDEYCRDKWMCIACTFLNPDDKVDCTLCGHSRIKVIDCEIEASVTENEKSKELDLRGYLELVEASNAVLMPNTEKFYCIICMTNCGPGEGVVLSECLHQFCRECLKGTITNGEEQGAHIVCPYVDDTYRCEAVLTERELRHLVDEEVYERHLAAALREAKANLSGNNNDHVYQCRTADCIGWCTYEDGVNNFWCQACFKTNCLNCQAIHEDETCAQYQDRIQTEARTNDEARQTNEQLQNLLVNGEAMKCPSCGIILAKRSGCDWLVCSSCRTEICWATRGPRWGPNGRGDTSGGCRCRENGQLCHPQCGNCH